MIELSTQLKTYGWTVENGLSALVKIIGKFVRKELMNRNTLLPQDILRFSPSEVASSGFRGLRRIVAEMLLHAEINLV